MFFILSPYVLENQSVLNFLFDGFLSMANLANHKL